MNNLFSISSPLEQFEILPAISFYFGILDFSITNEAIILFLIFFLFILFLKVVLNKQILLYLLFLTDGKL